MRFFFTNHFSTDILSGLVATVAATVVYQQLAPPTAISPGRFGSSAIQTPPPPPPTRSVKFPPSGTVPGGFAQGGLEFAGGQFVEVAGSVVGVLAVVGTAVLLTRRARRSSDSSEEDPDPLCSDGTSNGTPPNHPSCSASYLVSLAVDSSKEDPDPLCSDGSGNGSPPNRPSRSTSYLVSFLAVLYALTAIFVFEQIFPEAAARHKMMLQEAARTHAGQLLKQILEHAGVTMNRRQYIGAPWSSISAVSDVILWVEFEQVVGVVKPILGYAAVAINDTQQIGTLWANSSAIPNLIPINCKQVLGIVMNAIIPTTDRLLHVASGLYRQQLIETLVRLIVLITSRVNPPLEQAYTFLQQRLGLGMVTTLAQPIISLNWGAVILVARGCLLVATLAVWVLGNRRRREEAEESVLVVEEDCYREEQDEDSVLIEEDGKDSKPSELYAIIRLLLDAVSGLYWQQLVETAATSTISTIVSITLQTMIPLLEEAYVFWQQRLETMATATATLVEPITSPHWETVITAVRGCLFAASVVVWVAGRWSREEEESGVRVVEAEGGWGDG